MQIMQLPPDSIIYRPCRSYSPGICVLCKTQTMNKYLVCLTCRLLYIVPEQGGGVRDPYWRASGGNRHIR